MPLFQRKEKFLTSVRLRSVILWYEQAISYFREGERIRIYGLDITERKQAEEALQNALEEPYEKSRNFQALLEASRAVIIFSATITAYCSLEIVQRRSFFQVPEGTDMSNCAMALERLAHYRASATA